MQYRKTKPADDKKAKIEQLLQSIATKHRSLGPFVLYLSSRDNVEFNDCSLDAWCTFDCTIPGIDLFAVNLDQYDLPGANTDPIGKAFKKANNCVESHLFCLKNM